MCTVCGCGEGETRIEGQAHTHRHADGTVHSHVHDPAHAHGHEHEHLHTHPDDTAHSHPHDHPHDHSHGHAHPHTHADGTTHVHEHDHAHDHAHGHDQAHDHSHGHVHATTTEQGLHYGTGAAGTSVAGLSQKRLVQIERDILAHNDGHAQRNRQWLAERGILALNLVSSPGSGKTTLLVRTIQALAGRLPVAVIEGDQQTTHDADRIRATGAPALQINTGKGCHLDAAMVETALQRLAPAAESVLMIENVGNLVCPAAFDLGEAHKVVVLSVTEGEDKPLKYPDMFHAADLMLLNKTDLLPHLQFDVAACVAYARRVNPGIQVIELSATSGQGLDRWLAWIHDGVQRARAQRQAVLADLQRQVESLQGRLAALQAAGPAAS